MNSYRELTCVFVGVPTLVLVLYLVLVPAIRLRLLTSFLNLQLICCGLITGLFDAALNEPTIFWIVCLILLILVNLTGRNCAYLRLIDPLGRQHALPSGQHLFTYLELTDPMRRRHG